MKTSEIRAIKALAEKAEEYAVQYREIQSPAYIQFQAFGRKLRELCAKPDLALQGSVLDLTALRVQALAVCQKYGVPLLYFSIDLTSVIEPTVMVEIKRLFKADKDYDQEKQTFYTEPPSTVIQVLEKWLESHAKEAQEITGPENEIVMHLEEKEEGES